jgi:hypothetical protein
MSTKDQILSSELHGEALLTARRPELQPLIDHLREVAQGRDDIRVECAGILAGSWFSSAARRGEDLIAAGLLMLAGPVDLDELDRWMRIGWERRRGATVPYPDGERQILPPGNGRNRGAGYAVQMAANGGSGLLIFIPRATHGHDLSLSFVVGRVCLRALQQPVVASRSGAEAMEVRRCQT